MNEIKYTQMIKEISAFMDASFAGNPTKNNEIEIARIFNTMDNNEREDFCSWLDNLLENDTITKLSLLSAIYHATPSPWALGVIDNIIKKDKLDYDLEMGLWRCTISERFVHGFSSNNYEDNRIILSNLTQRFAKLIGAEQDKHKHSYSDNKRVVIITEQLLSLNHAPSRIVSNFYNVFHSVLNYEVLLVVAAERKGTTEACEGIFFDIRYYNYFDALWGAEEKNVIMDDGQSMRTIQIAVNSHNIDDIQRVLSRIYEFNPMYVLNIGEPHCLAEMLCKRIPLASMPCSAGIAISGAPYLIRYMRGNHQCEDDFALLHGQAIIDISLGSTYIITDHISKEELGISRGAFLIMLMGNRLDYEIDDEFKSIMEKIILDNPQVEYVIVGECSLNFGIISGHIHFLGYRSDFMAIMECADLYMNPKRNGAGSGARAVLFGTPVITLDNCDVASALDSKAFICDSYEQYPELVDRYIHDTNYMQSQLEACEDVKKKREGIKIQDEVIRMDYLIREQICTQNENSKM